MRQTGSAPRARTVAHGNAPRAQPSTRPTRHQHVRVRAEGATAASAGGAVAATAPPKLGVSVTSYEGNTLWLKFNATGARVLVDPWLVGDLTFFDQDWLYVARKSTVNKTVRVDVDQVAAETDLLLLTQWVDDHVHLPTLRALPKGLPVIAQREAAERVRALGFTDVRVAAHGQSVAAADGRLDVLATPGALVGPPWVERQNCYLLRERPAAAAPAAAGATVYLDPHCDFVPSALARLGRVDVVVAPCASVLLAGYPLLMGSRNLEELLERLQPGAYVPLLNTDIEGDGPLSALMSKEGGQEGLAARLAARGLTTRVVLPATPGQALEL